VTAASPASLAPPGLPGLDPAWSGLVTVPDGSGTPRTWHVLDTAAAGSPPADCDAAAGSSPANGEAAAPAGTLLCVHGNPTWSYLWRRLLAAPPQTAGQPSSADGMSTPARHADGVSRTSGHSAAERGRVPGWRVVAPDQLGMGYSERLPAPRALAERVDDLGRLTAALDLPGPVVVVAHDWGGPIALGWALAHREQLGGAVLFNTAVHHPAGAAPPALIRLARAPLLRYAGCVRTPAFVRAATALSRPPLPSAVRAAFAAPYATNARRRAVGDFVADIPVEPDHPSRPALAAIADGLRTLDVPALLLWGPRDPVFGERHLADLLERLPRARLHRYERAAHLVPEDAPGYVDVVAQWLADLESPRPATSRAGGERPPASPSRPRPPLWAPLDDRAGNSAPAVVAAGGAVVSWRLLARRVRELAAGLAAGGVRPGDRVALLVPPSPDLTAAVYAVWRAGAVIVVADKGLGVRGMGRALRGARVDHVIGTAQGLAAAGAMRLPGTRIAAGPMTRATMRALGAERGLADVARVGRTTPPPDEPGPEAECAVVFTSGATGPAKGVVYRHRQVQAQIELIRSTYALGPEDRLVAAFAPFALLGPALGIASAVPDMDVTSPGTLTAAALADAAAAVDATVVFASPAALRGVLASAAGLSPAQRTALGRVRLVMSAGAPVPVSLLSRLREVLPAAAAHTPYGMTEVLPVTDVSLAELEAAGTGDGVGVGRPLPGVDVAVSPLSPLGVADRPLTSEPALTGEVCVRAEHGKDRYDALWATERAAGRDPGWHRTGDVGHLDAQGRLWVEGRLGHVVTTAAGPVTPVGVEQRVEAWEEVQAAAAVGVGPAGTQQLVVVVVPAGDGGSARSPLAELALTDAVRRVAGVPVAAVLVRPALPVDIRHASKVDRQALAGWAGRILAGARV